jgi:hypothetical protein
MKLNPADFGAILTENAAVTLDYHPWLVQVYAVLRLAAKENYFSPGKAAAQ